MQLNYPQTVASEVAGRCDCHCEIKTNVQKMTQQKDGLYFAGGLVALTICALCYAARPTGAAAVSGDQFPDAADFLLGRLTCCSDAVERTLSSTSVERPVSPVRSRGRLRSMEVLDQNNS